MRKIMLSAAALIFMTTACKKTEEKVTDATTPDTTTVVTDETPAEAAKPMDSAAMMKAWEAFATPGEPHKMLAADNGSWNEATTMWEGPDDTTPTKGTMTAENKMILGGRYQQSVHKGNFMGMPFEGISTVGYNNASKKMESSWTDNMGTGIMHMEGDYNAAGKVINFKGRCVDPMTGKEKAIRETFTMVDDKTRKMEMYDTDPSGKEYKSMEIVMTRK
jgi:hypothetical protein